MKKYFAKIILSDYIKFKENFGLFNGDYGYKTLLTDAIYINI